MSTEQTGKIRKWKTSRREKKTGEWTKIKGRKTNSGQMRGQKYGQKYGTEDEVRRMGRRKKMENTRAEMKGKGEGK